MKVHSLNEPWQPLLTVIQHPRFLYAVSWLVALGAVACCLFLSWITFDDPRRSDGNSGHTQIDFGGQWLIGRMLVQGHGHGLYNRSYQRAVLREAYPREDERPGQPSSDADDLMNWIMGRDDPLVSDTLAVGLAPLAAHDSFNAVVNAAGSQHVWETNLAGRDFVVPVGGPLYPPISALFNTPLGVLSPRTAYRISQAVNLLLAFAAGLAIRVISRGRIWWPVASAAIIAFPGLGASCNLGQNAALTLAILVWGWALIASSRPGWGGTVWGLLAFKPVWATAFFLVPVLTRRWRVCLAMLGSAAALVVATLPLVGWQSWLDWLKIGREGSQIYNIDRNWIFLSRDVLSIPRRWLLDFSKQGWLRDENWLLPALVGWCLLLAILEITVRLAVLRKEQARAVDGPPAAFILLGAWLCCFHFMYYDVLLTALPIFLLFSEPRRYLERTLLLVVPLRGSTVRRAAELERYYNMRLPDAYPPPVSLRHAGAASVWVLNRMVPTLVLLLYATEYVFPYIGLGHHEGTPWETFFLIALWAWSGWLWLRETHRRDAESAEKKTAEKKARETKEADYSLPCDS